MSNRGPPKVIITDQDAAIARAISEVFPDILHRFCLWHILNKFSEKLNATLYKEQYHKLLNIIKESESAEEFENQWSGLMNSTKLGHNKWLNDMYTIRRRWVPAYVRHNFAAGMSSSQRVESKYSFFKRYLHHNNSLIDFITRFNRVLVHQRHEELVVNHNDRNEVSGMVTGFPMEQKMSSIYTKRIILLFQKELQESMTYICELVSNTIESKVYMVKQFEPEKPVNRQRKLTYHISSDLISCSCQLFEFEGYPCRHMLCLMRVMQIMMLPDRYIVKRWTKKAKTVVTFEQTSNLAEGQSFLSRRIILARSAMELVDDCSLTEARSNFLMGELQNLMVKAKYIDDGSNIEKKHTKSSEFTNVV